MDSVKVDKDKLLEKLQENRERHINTFEEVLENYKAEAVRQLEEHIERIRSGAVERVHVVLPPPKNYEAEYDKAIAMVEWELMDVIELSQYDFQTYVLDQWAWKEDFIATSAMYSDKSR